MSHNENMLIINGNIVAENGEVFENGALYIKDGRIEWLGSQEQFSGIQEQFNGIQEQFNGSIEGQQRVVDAFGGWVLPGFIDVHVHGGYGYDFMDAAQHAFDEITRFHGIHGTTAMLATTVTAPQADLSAVIDAVHEYTRTQTSFAQLLGVHLEGPFISPKWPGAQNPKYIVPPQKKWLEDWVAKYPGVIRMLTLAPETQGALELIEWLKGQGIVPACGHTDATYDVIQQAANKGLRHAVHTFNAMKGLHHREPGTVGAILTDERISAEIIADGHHVHLACIQLLAKVKSADNLILITDAMCAAGLGDGLFQLGGLEVSVNEGVAHLVEGNSLAGSTLTMIDAFRFVVQKVGLSVPQASRMASTNPAKLLGIDPITGGLKLGKQADVLLITSDLQLSRVWVKGKEIHFSNLFDETNK